jgi:phytoene dehydrogenase-like protein
MNLPIWNLAQMTEGKLQQTLTKESQARPGSWGALTLYFGVKASISEIYQQIHLKNSDVKNYFVSFSLINDELRAPEGYQAVSISTHVEATQNFDSEKHRLANIIMQDFTKRFAVEDIKHFTIGTPKTFERYTGRKNGFVGGLPFLYGKNPLSLLSPVTSEKDVFRVGDTVFPGQGLCGVVAGALQLHHRLV